MAVNAERKIAAAGVAGGMLALLAVLLVLSGLTLGLGATQDTNGPGQTSAAERSAARV